MKFVRLKDGDEIPVLGLGTWPIGGGMSSNTQADEETVSGLRKALKMGYRHIDTAEMYGGGHTEELIGQAITGADRGELFLTSKIWTNHHRYVDVLSAADGIRRRLGTDYLDLLLIHWPNDRVPLQETFRAMNELLVRGKVRHLGVSNFDLGRLQEAEKLAEAPLATNQIPYSLTQRRYVDNGVVRYCQERGIVLTAYGPLKGGVLRHSLVRDIARQRGATPAQVALAWLIRQPGVITIPKSANPAHLRENLAALDVTLTDEDIHKLDRIQ